MNINDELIEKAMKVDLDKIENRSKQIQEDALKLVIEHLKLGGTAHAWSFIKYIQDCVEENRLDLAEGHIKKQEHYIEEIRKEEVKNE